MYDERQAFITPLFVGPDLRRSTGMVAPRPPKNRNTFHRVYFEVCFSKIMIS
jgi:hypothetical protein